MSAFETGVFEAPGARLQCDVRGDVSAPGASERLVFLIDWPMDAAGFGTLTELLDHH